MKLYLKIILFISGLAILTFIYFYLIGFPLDYKDYLIIKYNKSKVSRQKVNITFSYGGNDYGNSLDYNVKTFLQDNPNVEIKLQQLPSTTDYRRDIYLSKMFSGDDSIDVFLADIAWINEFASSNLVLPLDKYFTKSIENQFIQNILATCKYKGKIYALPLKTDAPFLYYRSDIIKSPPKTYTDLINLANQNMNYPGIKYGYVFQGYTYEGLVCNSLEFIWNNGGKILDDDKVVINSPEARAGLQQFVDIVNSDISSYDMLNFQEDDSYMSFSDGSAIFMRNWPYAYNRLKFATSKVKNNFDVAPLPIGPMGKVSTGAIGGWNFMINKNTKNPDLCWKFINHMTSYNSQVWDNTSAAGVPTRTLVYENSDVKAKSPWLHKFKNIIVDAKLRPFSKDYSSLSKLMQINFKKALTKEITVCDALQNIETELIKIYPAK